MAAAIVAAPADLRETILSGLRTLPERDQAPQEWARLGWLARLVFRPAFAFALLFLLVLPALYLMRPKEPSIPGFALESHEKLVGGTLSYIREESPEKLREFLVQSVGGRFAPMGYDLSSMGLRPVGGVVQEVGGRKVLVAVYKGVPPSLTCYTFLGTEEDVPDEATPHVDPEKKINFYTFSRSGVNGVMHREGQVICILVSRLPMEDLLALARSKAQPAPPLGLDK